MQVFTWKMKDESVNINRVDNTPEAEVDITESNNNQETQIDNESIQSDDLTEYLIDHEHQQHEEASDKWKITIQHYHHSKVHKLKQTTMKPLI